MLVIRLARGGRAKYPTYRIVAAESARAATGKFVEVLGHYNPHTKELVVKKEQTEKRLSDGAQPSNSVIKLLQREKVALPEWVNLKTKTRNPKKEPVEKPAAVAPTVEAEASTGPAAEEITTKTTRAEEVVVAAASDHADAVAENKTDDSATETAENVEEQENSSKESSNTAAENAADTAKE